MSRILVILALFLSGCSFHVETNDQVQVDHCTVQIHLGTGEDEDYE